MDITKEKQRFNYLAETVDRIFKKVPNFDNVVYGYRSGLRGRNIYTDNRMGTVGIFASIHALDGAIGFQQITPDEYSDYVLYRIPTRRFS